MRPSAPSSLRVGRPMVGRAAPGSGGETCAREPKLHSGGDYRDSPVAHEIEDAFERGETVAQVAAAHGVTRKYLWGRHPWSIKRMIAKRQIPLAGLDAYATIERSGDGEPGRRGTDEGRGGEKASPAGP